MSGAYFALRLVFSFIIAAMITYAIYEQDERERSAALEEGDKRSRYVAYFPPLLYPLFVTLLLALTLAFETFGDLRTVDVLAVFFEVFFYVALFYALLLALLPLLRRRISARLCAALWALPNLLYLGHMSYMALGRPLAVVMLPQDFLRPVLALWAIGFAAVLGYQIFAHLFFRHRILREAEPIPDPKYTQLWREEMARARVKKQAIPLLRSAAVATPLSIGLFRHTVRVVLPERHYTEAELRLIYRHELVHIGREDSGMKFFMVFTAAMFWFNPLMWLALRRSAEDLELGCDETVLLDADEATRRQYAELLLKTAGDDRGFSSCLSASAKSLRYRLKNVMKPVERSLGAGIAMLAMLLLFLSFGQVAFAYEEVSVKDELFNGRNAENVEVSYFTDYGSSGRFAFYDYNGGDALYSYLNSLELHRITGNYKLPSTGEKKILVTYNADGVISLSITEHFVKVARLHKPERHDHERQEEYFYCQQDIDFDYLNS
ncbi:MAG: M56 family metallopeptidase, partial [Oscillospiraceae bacterium]|nr:M56 family metallopeptidase [Oscillospiraceae bacterium]